MDVRPRNSSAPCTHSPRRRGSEASHSPAGRPPIQGGQTAVRQQPGPPAKLSPIPRPGLRGLSRTRICFHPPARREGVGPAGDMKVRPLDRQRAPRQTVCWKWGKRANMTEGPEIQLLVKGIFRASENALNTPNASTSRSSPSAGGRAAQPRLSAFMFPRPWKAVKRRVSCWPLCYSVGEGGFCTNSKGF